MITPSPFGGNKRVVGSLTFYLAFFQPRNAKNQALDAGDSLRRNQRMIWLWNLIPNFQRLANLTANIVIFGEYSTKDQSTFFFFAVK